MVFSCQRDPTKVDSDKAHKNIRSHPYFYCLEVPVMAPKPHFVQQYHFTSVANPYSSHLQNFQTFSPLSTHITKQLISFTIDCIRNYRSKLKQSQLYEDFFPRSPTPFQSQVRKICNSLIAKPQVQFDQFSLQQYPTTLELLSETMDEQSAEYIVQVFLTNLKKYRIVTRQEKISNIKQLASKLTKYFKIELNINSEKQQMLLRIQHSHQTERLVTLEDLVKLTEKPFDNGLVRNKKRNLLITQQGLQNCYRNIYREVVQFNKNSSSPYGAMYEKDYFRPHPTNILAYVGKETPFYFELSPEGMSIDLIPLFLEGMGLQDNPCSLEQMLVFGSQPSKMRVYDFSKVIKEKKKEENYFTPKELQISSILSWLLTVDYLNKKFIENKEESPLEMDLEPEVLFSSIQDKEACFLSNSTNMLISVYELSSQEESNLLHYNYHKWQLFLRENYDDIQEQYLNSNRFSQAKLIAEAMERIFYNEKSLKDNIKHDLLKDLANVGRYILLYLLIKYQQLVIEENILGSNYQMQNLKDEKYCLNEYINKIVCSCKDIARKVNEDYRKNREDVNSIFIKQNPQLLELFDKLQQRNIEHLWLTRYDDNRVDPKTPQKQISRIYVLKTTIREQCFRLLFSDTTIKICPSQAACSVQQLQKQKHNYIYTRQSIYVQNFLKQELLMQVFFLYSIDRYSGLKAIQADISEFSKKDKSVSLQQIRLEYEAIRRQIEQLRNRQPMAY